MSTTLSPAILKRAKIEALAYIKNLLRVCYHDCSDSGDEAERHQARFDAIVEDSISMEAFIEQHLLADYAGLWKAFVDDLVRTEDWWATATDDDKQNPLVCDLPIPYERFKHLL